MELIAPLSAAGFFCLYDGVPASFIQIVREFEIMCNTRIKSRWSILNRKNKLTHFFDILRNTLIEAEPKITCTGLNLFTKSSKLCALLIQLIYNCRAIYMHRQFDLSQNHVI